ncbi:hypothetical protein V9L05_23410 (plasmid) [Bernardetia sp. Wsw4-3y2]|uniref:Eco57I restriction-modification methylase domain-containing protein n=1 Tax=Bernardetia sp. Wsw4-3y2 TaxID=3127471 RepID=UPI0030D39ED7
MTLEEYISKINQRFQLGNATEHTFRGDLQTLLESIVPKVSATNEPKRIACGAPDYVLTKNDIPVGFIEAKDIGDRDLEGKKKTDFKPTKEQRFRVFLTNSLEEGTTELETSFAGWLSTEANEANKIKKDTPVMVVLGNPPYAVSSTNKSDWIQNLIADYKKNLKEKNIQPLSDDYIKFIRFGQHFIDKNKSGVLAFITNNSFLDGIIHRQMRKHLLESFDEIYVLDLHGNSKKKETLADGTPDQNVFDIMQGVSINIFVKTGEKQKNELAKIFHFDLMGNRELKFDFLEQNSLKSIKWKTLKTLSPNYFFVPKDFEGIKIYS